MHGAEAAQAASVTFTGIGSSALLGSFFIMKELSKTPRSEAALRWVGGNAPSTVMDEMRRIESENARLRAIFPRILEALQSGACTPDCSVEFLEMIPNEVAGIMRKLRMPNVKSEPRSYVAQSVRKHDL